MPKDYYKILGVSQNASGEEIKKAYRRLAHQYHPDKANGNENKFKEINEAYQILSDQEKRRRYDQFGTAEPFGAGGGFGGGTPGGFNWDFSNFGGQAYADVGDLGDIFDMFFEGMGVKPKRRTYQRGSDLEVAREITLEEAFGGVSHTLQIKTAMACAACQGLGREPKTAMKTCTVCNGRGEVREQRRTFFGQFSQVKGCVTCQGLGQVPEKVCQTCRGRGVTSGTREIKLEILPGIQNNQIIKITGAGEAGERGATAGDLYVRVKIKPHAVFTRRNDDLIVTKELKILDLLLGHAVEIPTIQGKKIQVEIPAGVNLKEEVRVNGEGMPRFGRSGRGDLLIDLTLRAPKKPNAKEREILEKLER